MLAEIPCRALSTAQGRSSGPGARYQSMEKNRRRILRGEAECRTAILKAAKANGVKKPKFMSRSTSVSGGRRIKSLAPFDNSVDCTVSVITAVFNAQDCIADCIESVLTQDYPNIECIIVDAASTDGTVDVIRRYDDKIDLWISEPDTGIFDAWNKGLKLASGNWIAFLGADDIYLPGAIRKYMNLALKCSGADFLSSHARLIHPSGYSPVFGAPWKWPACARALTTIHVGTMHRRSLFERYGNFDTSYRSAGDYEFLLRAGAQLKAAFMPEVTVMVRAGGASESTANIFERKRAKTQRRVRSATAATLDLMVDIVRFHLRRLILSLWSRAQVIIYGAKNTRALIVRKPADRARATRAKAKPAGRN